MDHNDQGLTDEAGSNDAVPEDVKPEALAPIRASWSVRITRRAEDPIDDLTVEELETAIIEALGRKTSWHGDFRASAIRTDR